MLSTVVLVWGVGAWWIERHGRRALPEDALFDAIVILGCRVMPSGRPSSSFARRIRLAVHHFHQGRAPALICTGGVGDAPFAESEVAKQIAVEMGVPPQSIWTESESTTTQRNALAAAAAFPNASLARVLVVTDAFHVWRASRVFGRHFAGARGSGTVHPSWRLRAKGALREFWAIAGYAAAGRL